MKPGMATAEETLRGAAAPHGGAQEASVSEAVLHPDWFPDLVKQHLRRVFSVLYRMVGNHADAQDLAQEVFLKAFERRNQLRDPARAAGWLMRIASNTAIDFRRSRSPERTAEPWDESADLGPRSPTPEQIFARSENERRLHEALRLLSPKERAAIVLRDLEGVSGPEVARMLGCSAITVRTHIASARIKLRRYFQGKTVKGNKE